MNIPSSGVVRLLDAEGLCRLGFVVPSEHKAHLQLAATLHVGRYSAARVVLGGTGDAQVVTWFAPVWVWMSVPQIEFCGS
jgi:hypothetical protein